VSALIFRELIWNFEHLDRSVFTELHVTGEKNLTNASFTDETKQLEATLG
jgi:hypothetical protein